MRSLKWQWDWRWAAIKNGLLDAAAYRGEFLIDILGSASVPVIIQLVVWNALFVGNDAGVVAGHTYREMMCYTIASVFFSQVRGGDLDFELGEMIRTGQLSQYLLRPVSVVEFVFLRGTAYRYLVAILCLIAGLAFGHFIGIQPGRMVGAMVLALMGNVIHFQMGAALSAVAFIWEEAYSLLMVKNLLVSLLSGEMIPLFLFPEKWSWIWKSTPFYLYVYGPIEYSLGRWTHAQLMQGFALGLIWMLGAWGLIHLTWRLGLKRYASIGG